MARNTLKGKYKVKNPKKYAGDPTKVIYRSSWERQLMRWCDANPAVEKWGSETVVIPYICQTDNKPHRYFMDFVVKINGKTTLIEVKPHSQTLPPKKPKRKTKKYINEVMTYVKNQSKWAAAEAYAENRGWQFRVYTENELRRLGLRIL